MRRRAGRVLFALYCLALFVGFGEAIVRLSGRESRHVPDRIYRPFDADIPFVHAPNLHDARGWDDTIFDTDGLGLRTVPGTPPLASPKPRGEYRVAMVGDSVTFGEGVAGADVFSQLLDERLRRAEPPIRVSNFGVSAYSVRQMVATVERRVAQLEPDLVLVVLIPDDFDLTRTGTLDGWGSVQPTESDGWSATLRALLRRSHLAYFVHELVVGRRPGWRPHAVSDAARARACVEFVARLRAACAGAACECGIVLFSGKVDDGFGAVGAALAREEWPIVDLTHLKDAFTRAAFDAGPYDPHPSAAVHRRIADALAPFVLARRDARTARLAKSRTG